MDMTGNISPYALLCQSRPKPASAPPTSYDLYSMTAQERMADKAAQPQSVPVSGPPAAQPLASLPVSAGRRTHYIADIHARHSTAIQRSPQSSCPL